MTSETEQDIEQQEAPVETVAAVALPGERLKTTREELHLSREEVAHHLHLDAQIVRALEEDRFDDLPSPAYVCGYLRSYARLLKLPETEVVNAYSKGQAINAALIPENISILPEKKTDPTIIKIVVLVVIVVLLIAAGMWFVDEIDVSSSGEKNQENATVTSTITIPSEATETAPVIDDAAIQRPAEVQQQIEQFNKQVESDDSITPTNSDQPANAAPGPLLIEESATQSVTETSNVSAESGDLRLLFDEDSWTEVTDADGHRHVYRLVKAGSNIFVNGVAPYVILLGNASGVKVFYNEKEFNHKRFQRDQIAYFRLGVK